MRKIIGLSVAMALTAAASAASADTIALDFTGGTAYGFVTDPQPNTVGWAFSLGDAVNVTKLGFYDLGGDGLAVSHQVGIWNNNQTLVASGTVVSSDVLQAGFRWTDISPVTLAAGSYRIGALVSSDDYYYSQAGTVTTATPVTYGGGAFTTGTFAYPDQSSYTTMGRFGPNFQFVTAAVPEPSAYLLVIAGLGVVAGIRRKRIASAA
jgi:hypothetical protein